GLLHASLLIADVARSRAFYEGVLGLAPAPRPDLGFPGLWYDVGGGQIHLLALPNPDPVEGRPPHGGRDRHIALGVAGWEAMQARLAAAGVPFTLSRSGRRALFCRDPDGNAIELVEV
ncbi:MAG: VOC family protein, partial [Gallionellaceae bacterium]|nr:VOC family protein [Gallionellaceae bacterium]